MPHEPRPEETTEPSAARERRAPRGERAPGLRPVPPLPPKPDEPADAAAERLAGQAPSVTSETATPADIPPRPPLPPRPIRRVAAPVADEAPPAPPVPVAPAPAGRETPPLPGVPAHVAAQAAAAAAETSTSDAVPAEAPVVDAPQGETAPAEPAQAGASPAETSPVDTPEREPQPADAPVAESPTGAAPTVDAPPVPAPTADEPPVEAPSAPEPATVPVTAPAALVVEPAAPSDPAAVEVDAAAIDALLSPLQTDDPAVASEAGADIPALELRGVTKVFGSTRAVDGIDLTVPTGSFYGLVGPNGAGKTTTLSMIAGLLRPDAGSIRVAGIDAAAHRRDTKKLMGVLPDRFRTFDRLTGRQLLHYYGVLRGLPGAVAERRALDLARAFDLSDDLSRTVADYSGGMTKKLMLAGAMIHAPRVLVLDEPFESVDPASSAVILDILEAYVAHGGTVILSSHGMDLVERVCTRVAVIVAGQVLAEGSVAQVRGELTLEQRLVQLAGGLSDVEGLEWLHTFSG